MSKILIIEDDRFLASSYEIAFSSHGFQVSIACDGLVGMQMAENNKPDIIILDLLLPKMSGFSVLSEMKKKPQLQHIPVVVASNLGEQPDIDHAKRLGATDYFVKSDSSIMAIIAKIKELILINKKD